MMITPLLIISILHITEGAIINDLPKGIVLKEEGDVILGLTTQPLEITIKLPSFSDIVKDPKDYEDLVRAGVDNLYSSSIKTQLSTLRSNHISRSRGKRFVFTTIAIVTLGLTAITSATSMVLSSIAIERSGKLSNSIDILNKDIDQIYSSQNNQINRLNSVDQFLLNLTKELNKMDKRLTHVESEMERTKTLETEVMANLLEITHELGRIRQGLFPSLLIDNETKSRIHEIIGENLGSITLDQLPISSAIPSIQANSIRIRTEIPVGKDVLITKSYETLNPGTGCGNISHVNVPKRLVKVEGVLYELDGDCKVIQTSIVCRDYTLFKSCFNSINSCPTKVSESHKPFLRFTEDSIIARVNKGPFFIRTGSSLVRSLSTCRPYQIILGDGEELVIGKSAYKLGFSLISNSEPIIQQVKETNSSQERNLAELVDNLERMKALDNVNRFDHSYNNSHWLIVLSGTFLIIILALSYYLCYMLRSKRDDQARINNLELGLAKLITMTRASESEG